MPHAEFPYVAFVAALLVVVPLPWHWRARNVATLAMIAWLLVLNIVYGVDAILWHGNTRIQAVVWCDITSRIIIGGAMALPAACMCISIHLAQVASVSHVGNTQAEKRRRQILELILCFGVPMLWMALHFTVQGHRFDIIEDYGCRPNTYISVPGILLVWVPPLIFSAITIVYSAIALMHFLHHRVTFARVLSNSNSGLTTSRYLRLMALAFTEIIVTAISSSIDVWFTSLSIRPWTNWADVHWNFSRIDTYPSVLLPPLAVKYYYATWYTVPFASLIYFVFFAFGQDAVKEYNACISWGRQRLLCCALRKNLSAPSRKFSIGPFASLGPARTITDHMISSLPSYQSAVGEDELTSKFAEKDASYKERYPAKSIDRTGIEPVPLHHITAFSDSSSYCSMSAPATPTHSTVVSDSSYPDLSPTPTHTHFSTHSPDLV